MEHTLHERNYRYHKVRATFKRFLAHLVLARDAREHTHLSVLPDVDGGLLLLRVGLCVVLAQLLRAVVRVQHPFVAFVLNHRGSYTFSAMVHRQRGWAGGASTFSPSASKSSPSAAVTPSSGSQIGHNRSSGVTIHSLVSSPVSRPASVA